MGLGGGLVGIGGSIIMIPLMVLCTDTNQHVIQAAAMLCNVAVGLSSCIAHLRVGSILPTMIKWLIPAALVSVLLGVAFSNSRIFEGRESYLLARLFGGYLVYVALYNAFHLYRYRKRLQNEEINEATLQITPIRSLAIGSITGFAAGLLGIGAGTVATPMQQLLLGMPIRRAMSNSAAAMVLMAFVGAVYKNLTLFEHGFTLRDSFGIAVFVFPAALIGGYIGGFLMHKLPQNLVRAVFIIILFLAAAKLLTVQPVPIE